MTSPLINMLVRHEGLSLFPYVCPAGKNTIGVGHNLDSLPLHGPIADYFTDNGYITRDMAFLLLESDILRCIDEASSIFHWFPILDETRQDVLIDMILNLGITRFKGFKKMIEALSRSDFTSASHEMLSSRWCSQIGPCTIEKADGQDRGAELASMMYSGLYQV